MDFQTVCEGSALGTDLVRFYVNEGLVEPLFTASHLPDDAEYAEEDLSRLLVIANLNRLNMPLGEVKLFFEQPERAPALLLEHHQRLQQEALYSQVRLAELDNFDLALFGDGSRGLDALAKLELDLPLNDPERQRSDRRLRSETIRRLQQELDDLAYDLTAMGMRQHRQFLVILVLIFLLLLALGWIVGPYIL
ncbi:MAG: hypothetical protein QM296_06105 [Bacillota bacterium]|nr:hypothetical protein [Bacillota bacterium]